MADITTTISDIQIFIENLHKEIPEVFSAKNKGGELPPDNKLLYRGELCEVKLAEIPGAEPGIQAENNCVIITVPDKKATDAAIMLKTWLRQRAQELLSEKTRFWGEKLSVQYNKVSVKDQKTLWGSCSHKGNLNFSWRIIKAPEAVLDYLIIHELAHIPHMNHGDDFWNLVARWCPGHKTCRKWLNTHKNQLFAEPEVS